MYLFLLVSVLTHILIFRVKELQIAALNHTLDDNGDINVTPVDFGQMQLGQRDNQMMWIR